MSAPPPSLLRTLDANLNRAREALRVMEDFARFQWDDAALAAALKTLRHDLAAAVPAGLAEHLIACRDICADVGRTISTTAESLRDSAGHAALAAGKRLSEALRSVEEYAKVVSPAFAAAVEQLRYRGYEVERRLALTLRARVRFAQVHLYVIITESVCRGDWFAAAEAALAGGADCLQLREKHLPDREWLARARRLGSLCRERSALCIVNDRADIAVAAGAHGVHLGQDDLALADVRRTAPPELIAGLSTHTRAQVEAAAGQAPDYIAVGPMFDTSTKPQPLIAGPAALAEARSITSIPIVAIGGINETNAAEVIEAGADCVCVCQGVVGQSDIQAAASMIRRQFSAARPQPWADSSGG